MFSTPTGSFLTFLLLAAAGNAKIIDGHNVTLRWQAEPSLPAPSSDQSATTVGDFIYVIGGCVADQVQYCSNVTARGYRFDPVNKNYIQLPDAPRSRYRHSAVAVGSKLYLLGGRTVEDFLITEVDVFDTESMTWDSSPLYWQDATSDLAAFSYGNLIYAVGGYDQIYNTLNTTQVLNVSGTPQWLQTSSVQSNDLYFGPMMVPRGDFSIALYGNTAYAFGGWSLDFCKALASMEIFDTTTGLWTLLDSNLYVGRGDKAFGIIKDHIFAIGGETKDLLCTTSVPVSDVEIFSINNQTWIVEEDIPQSRFRFPAATYNEIIYTFGGQHYYSNDCGCYHIADDVLSFSEERRSYSKKSPASARSPVGTGASAVNPSTSLLGFLGLTFVAAHRRVF